MSGFVNGKVIKDSSINIAAKLNKNAHTTNLADGKAVVNVDALNSQINANKLETGNADSIAVDNGYLQINPTTTKMIGFEEEIVFHTVNTDMVSVSLSDALRDKIDLFGDIQNLVNSVSLDLGWKGGSVFMNKNINQNTVGITDNVYRRNGVVSQFYPTIDINGNINYGANPNLIPITNIYNLVLNIKDWDKIKDFNPFIVISRYKGSGNKSVEGTNTTNPNSYHYRTSGFKVSKTNDPLKPSKINLNNKYQVLDFGQEYYFRHKGFGINQDPSSLSDSICPTGLNNNFNSVYLVDGTTSTYRHVAWTYLEFSIGIIYNGKEIISKPNRRIKMIMEVEINTINNSINSSIKFKFP